MMSWRNMHVQPVVHIPPGISPMQKENGNNAGEGKEEEHDGKYSREKGGGLTCYKWLLYVSNVYLQFNLDEPFVIVINLRHLEIEHLIITKNREGDISKVIDTHQSCYQM